MCQTMNVQSDMLKALFSESRYGDGLRERIAGRCRVSLSLVDQWIQGEKIMSLDYLPALYEITGNPLVYQMLIPPDCMFIESTLKPAQRDVLMAAADAARESGEAQREVLNGMADGILGPDELDGIATEHREAATAHMAVAALADERKQAVSAPGGYCA